MNNSPVSESAIVVTLTSGVDVEIGTLTPLAIQRHVLKSEELYPMPNKTKYEKPMPGALPDTNSVIPAERNPEYLTAINDVIQARALWLLNTILDTVVIGAQNEAEIVQRYAARVEKMRKRDVLVSEPDDSPFMIVLRNFLLNDSRDVNRILEVAQMHAPLSAPEVADGRALFRVDTTREARRNSPLRAITPHLQRGSVNSAEPSSARTSDSA